MMKQHTIILKEDELVVNVTAFSKLFQKITVLDLRDNNLVLAENLLLELADELFVDSSTCELSEETLKVVKNAVIADLSKFNSWKDMDSKKHNGNITFYNDNPE